MNRSVFSAFVVAAVGIACGPAARSDEPAKPAAQPAAACPMMDAAKPAAQPAAACPMTDAAKPVLKAQTLCPVTGKPISKATYADVEGVRVYTCCAACIETVKADPAACLAKIRACGECPECLCTVCEKCGEYKGSDACCKSGAVACGACGMHKGAPGCCKPDVLGKCVPCGLDPKACGMKPSACGMKPSAEAASQPAN